ncbi:NAD(P)/FAD-dependent oxidoreductase [Mucilaginibacter sp. Bleaf8]|uniref:NAD(P)/FAD-dependent oxidoreductase n=1 Tax=Mucilaginibacter sp. Bleaf8 TaxID=2834430 RepID=UPI001BD1A59E|nr:NAD(P)/FAD-dependent oxidoreductase [Mucilaginibacter sp. Bleaf8]MBS7564876.1 NAD(P)/FAD-dependent oxidoreductase [Mucilaginibacter sp. Bleaf8]
MENTFDVIIIGGSSAGLSAGMSLGRAMKNVLIIDSGNPCNKPTPHSHNFLTHDGWKPAEIMEVALNEVLAYPTVKFMTGWVSHVVGSNNHFEVTVDEQSQTYHAKKLLFATGIKDIMPNIDGFTKCWGKSVIHCPYCHGYEYRNQATGILMNGDVGADFSEFIRNWSKDITLFTNGPATLSAEKRQATLNRKIRIVEHPIKALKHENGYLKAIVFADGTTQKLDALYARLRFEQHSQLPALLGCELNEQGYLKVDEVKRTTVAGIYAAGDNSTPMRAVAAAVAAGGMAGAMINHEIINEAD